MVDFNINVAVDPSNSEKQIDRLHDSLSLAEKSATDLYSSLKALTALRMVSLADNIFNVQKRLNGVNTSAQAALKSVNKLKTANTSAASSSKSNTAAPITPQMNASAVNKSLASVNKSIETAIKRVDTLDQSLQRAFNIDTSGLDRAKTKIDNTKQSGADLGSVLKNAFMFLGGALAGTGFLKVAEDMTTLSNKVRLVTKDSQELEAVMNRLGNVANSTRQSFDSTVTVYSRAAVVTKQMGMSQNETLDFVESLNRAVTISGATAQEASAGMLQLSQGLASGRLSGDELRSVLEQIPIVADVIAEHLKVTRGELRQLGADGKITSRVIIDAFAAANDSLAERVGKTTLTMSQAWSVFRNNLGLAINEMNNSYGITRKIASVIMLLAENMDLLAKSAIAAGTALAVGFARNGVMKAVAAVNTLTAAMAMNPLGAIVIGITAAVAMLVQFSDQIALSADGTITLSDAFTVMKDFIVNDIGKMLDMFSYFWERVTGLFNTFINYLAEKFPAISRLWNETFGDLDKSFLGLVQGAARAVDGIVGVFHGLQEAIVMIFKELPAIIGAKITEMANVAITKIETMINNMINGINGITGMLDIDPIGVVQLGKLTEKATMGFADLRGQIVDTMKASVQGTNGAENAVLGLIGALDKASKKRIEAQKQLNEQPQANLDQRGVDVTKPAAVELSPYEQQIKLLEERAKVLLMTNREREVGNKLLAIEKSLAGKGVILDDGQRERLKGLIEQNIELENQASILDSLRQPQEELINTNNSLADLYQRGAITAGEYEQAILQLKNAQAELNITNGEGSFIDGFIVGMQEVTESVQTFGSEAGLIFADFFTSISDGFADSIANAIVFGDSLRESLGAVSRQILSEMLSALIKLAVQFSINRMMSKAMTDEQILGQIAVGTTTKAVQTSSAATSIATSKSVASSIATDNATIATTAAPAAALENAATFGGAAVAGIAALAAIIGMAIGAAAFKDGGYVSTGGAGHSESVPAKLSNGEFVVNAKSTEQFRPQLEAMNNAAKFASGGYVSGAGTSRSDSIPANLSNGEFVMNARATSRYRPQLESMNRGQGFADGGYVGGESGQSNERESNVISNGSSTRIINVLDPAMVGDFLATPEGEDVLVNVIRNNSDRVRGSLS